MIIPVILAGGQGLRLWPLSTKARPKPFAMIKEGVPTLFQSTLLRLGHLENLGGRLVVCGSEHRETVQAQAAAIGHAAISLLLEPTPRDTAAALCAAALLVEGREGPDAVILALPADHAIADDVAFATAVASGAELAAAAFLVTFAIKATYPAVEYGYLKLGRDIDAGKNQFRVDGFIEKPSTEMARALLAGGGYAWNSGMFMFTPRTLLENFAAFQPGILSACRKAMPSRAEGKHCLLDGECYGKAPKLSIDVAIMEKASNVAAVVTDMGWSDVGNWDSVWREAEKCSAGNAVWGTVHLVDCRDSIVHSDGPMIVGLGLEGIIAIAAGNAILVAPRTRSQDVKRIAKEITMLLRRSTAESCEAVAEDPDIQLK